MPQVSDLILKTGCHSLVTLSLKLDYRLVTLSLKLGYRLVTSSCLK